MQTIIELATSWEAVAGIAGIDPVESLPFKNEIKTAREEATNAFFQLDVIAEVLREKVELDWTNSNQQKWYPWFYNYKPGAGFSFYDSYFVWTGTDTAGGARLCVDTDEKAEFFGKQFLPLWNKFLNPNK